MLYRMGWLFGKKKPKVPLPQGRFLDEKALQFPALPQGEKVIQPEMLKKAAGLGELPPNDFPDTDFPALPETSVPQTVSQRAPLPVPQRMEMPKGSGPRYIKVGVYQRILGEMDGLKETLTDLQGSNRKLDDSEYNEESNFEHLKKSVKLMHDRLLQIDKVIYKDLGD